MTAAAGAKTFSGARNNTVSGRGDDSSPAARTVVATRPGLASLSFNARSGPRHEETLMATDLLQLGGITFDAYSTPDILPNGGRQEMNSETA